MTKYVEAEKMIEFLEGQGNTDEDCTISRIWNVHRCRVLDFVYKECIEFDDDGWCWDMSKAPKDKVIDLCCNGERVADCEWLSSRNVWVCPFGHVEKPIAWRPIPPMPKKEE